MPQDFDLIRYPFKIKDKEEAILFRVDDSYEMRFTRDLFSKRVLSTASTVPSKVFIEIEIEDDTAKIISETKVIHDFRTPADFYVPINQNAADFYKKMHSALIDNDLNTILNMAAEISGNISENGFPELPLPLTTTFSHFENYETTIGRLESFPKIPAKQIKYGEEVPCSVEERQVDLLKKYLSKEQFEAQDLFYKKYFEKTPITRFKTIAICYEEESSCLKNTISLNLLKRCIGLHAYFMISGPWRKCWVRFNYDPATDRENYKYQSVEMRSKHANFQVFQKPEIVAEITKNKDWYLLSTCDPIDGFISKALKNFIIYTIDNLPSKEIDKKIEELHDSDFEIFEI